MYPTKTIIVYRYFSPLLTNFDLNIKKKMINTKT